MPMFEEDEGGFADEITIPHHALCLRVPQTRGEELVVHRENGEDFVFLFEALDDAHDAAAAAAGELGFEPDVARVRVEELCFRHARFKPFDGEPVDVVLGR